MYCTNCGNKLNEGVNFCNNCGKEVRKDNSTYCTVCGGKLNPRNGMCMRCTMARKKQTPEVVNKPRDTRSIKLNVLLNLGVIMVLVAGFVLATTNWSIISDWGKVGLLFGLSIFFMLMHLLCEKKLKIKVSAVIYFFLSLTFIFFTGICLTYLQMFGHWFSLAGPGKFLCLASLALLFTILTVLLRLKYNKKWITLFTFIGSALVVFFVCKYFGLGWLANLAIISLLMLLLYLYTANSVYKYVTIVLSLIVFAFEGLFVNIVQPEYNIIAGTTLTVCNGLLLFVFGYLQKNKVVKALSSVSLFLFFMLFLNYSLMGSKWLVSISAGIVLLLLLMVLIINAINENNNKYDVFSRTSKICSICSIAFLLITYSTLHNYYFLTGYYFDPLTDIFEYLVNLTIVSFILVFCDALCIKEKTTIYKPVYIYLLPFFLLTFIFNLTRLVVRYVPGVTFSVCAMVYVLLFFILYLVYKKGIVKTILHIMLYVLLFITMFIYLFKSNLAIESVDGIAAVLLPVLTLILYFREKKLDKYSLAYRWMSIIIFAISFINIVGTKDVFGFGSRLALIVTVASLVLLVLLFMDDMVIRRFIPFILLIPISRLLGIFDLTFEYEVIIFNIYSLLVLFLFAKTFSLKTYNILMIVGTTILLLQPTLYINISLSVYVSIVSILLIIYDLFSKRTNGLFTVGIIYLIINTLIILKDIWSHMSLWTYLLIAGIVLIIITTILIARNANKKD